MSIFSILVLVLQFQFALFEFFRLLQDGLGVEMPFDEFIGTRYVLCYIASEGGLRTHKYHRKHVVKEVVFPSLPDLLFFTASPLPLLKNFFTYS